MGGSPPLPALCPRTFGRPLSDCTPVLVMLSGFPDSHALWDAVVAEFSSVYHMVSIVTPDYDQPALRSRWGYTPNEVVDMIEAAILEHLGPTHPFDLLMHDFGCWWGFVIEGRLAPRVRKAVALDVGIPARPGTERVRGFFWQIPYQLFFATVFYTGARASPALAQALLTGMYKLGLFELFGPLGFKSKGTPRPREEIRWWLCYPYFHLWYGLVCRLRMPRAPRMLQAPLLFLWGKRKRTMFHSEDFVERLRKDPGCLAVELDCGHWLQTEAPAQMLAEMRSFLLPFNGAHDIRASPKSRM